MRVCPNYKAIAKDPRFQKLMEHYKEYDSDDIIDSLDIFREQYDYDDDFYPETPGQRGMFTRFLKYEIDGIWLSSDEAERLEQKNVDLMYETMYRTFTPAQLESRLSMLQAVFSYIVEVEAQKQGVLLKSNADRQQVIKSFGKDGKNPYVSIMQKVFELIENFYAKDRDFHRKNILNRLRNLGFSEAQMSTDHAKASINRKIDLIIDAYKKVLELKDQLAALAAPRIGDTEGFIVSIKGNKVSFTDMHDEDTEDTDEEGKTDDGEDYEEGTKGERYTDFRVLKLMETLSPKAKKFLSKLYKVDFNGHVVYDDINMPETVGTRQAAVVLHRVLRNSTPQSFMDDIKAAAVNYPWLTGLWRELNRHPEYQTTIYDAFKKCETNYFYMNFENGNMKPSFANSRASGNVIMREAGNNITGGYVLDPEFSIYTEDRLLKSNQELAEIARKYDAFDNPKINDAIRFINMVTDDAGLSDKAKLRWISEIEKEYNEDFHYLLNVPEKAMDIFLAKNPDVLPTLARALRGCGVTVDEKDLRTLALQKFTKRSWKFMSDKRLSDSDKYGRNKLYQIIRATNGLLGKAQETVTMSKRYNNLGNTNTGQYFYNTASYQFKLLNNVLSLAKYNETEERVFNNGKSLSTNNDVNLLHQIVDELSNSDRLSKEDYRKMIMDKYAKYEGMSLGDGDTMRLTGWLKEMYDGNHAGVDSNRSARFRLIDVCGYNHLEYSEMNKSQHILAAMAMYFKHREMEGFCGSYVGYEVPIQADYSTAYNFVTGPSYGCAVPVESILENKRKQELSAIDENDTEEVERIKSKYDSLLEELKIDKDKRGSEGYRADRRLTLRIDGKLYAAGVVNLLADETLIELERIQAIRDRENDPSWKLDLGTYDRQGKRFQIFPEFNDNGFEEKYASFDNADEARDFLLEQVAAQLEKVIADDIRTLNESKVLSHPAMKSMKEEYYGDDLFAEDGKFESLPGYAQARLQDFFLNTFYARQQMCKIFTGGMQQFNGLLDYEKRNMILHATHSSMYTEAKDRLGNKVGKSTQNCLYLEDDVAESAIMQPVSEMLGQLLKKNVITRDQYDTMLKSYRKIKTTDGQAFRTLESYRSIMMMADKWDDAHEGAYRKIMSYSEHPSIDLSDAVSVLMDGIKPIYTGFEEVQAYPGQKPVRMTVLHKYSETLLLPYFLAEHCLGSQSAPLRGLSMARREFAKQGKDIDLFIMHSGVKVGAFSVASPFAKDKKTGSRLLKDADGIRDYLVEYVNTVPGAVHTLDMRGYGIAASVSHDPMDERIAIASQAEKVGMANIEDGDKVNVNGREMDAIEARELYYQIKSADIIDMYKQLRSLFFSSEALDKAFREEISSRPYSSMEMQYALCLLKNGQFAVPLFAPNVEHQVQQLMASMIKKRLTKPKSEGANILQTTGFGVDMDVQGFDDRNAIADSDKLEVKFEGEGENKHIKYVEVFMPLNDSRLKVFADSDGKITPERLQELIGSKTIPEEMLEFVAYRTPSDAEHSVIPCRIKGFTSPADGPSIKMPKDVMVLTGHDYDGDKMRCHFKSFRLVDRSDSDTELTDDEVTQMILGQKAVNPEFKKCVLDEYDYSKPAYENTRAARVNERVSLFFAQLTSPAGSRRVLIPGGCDMTKVYAKSIYLAAASRNPSQMEVIRKALSNLGMAGVQIRSVTSDTSSLYDYLSSLSDGELSDIMNAVNGYSTPFSMTHAADSFEYMMGGADMIGIYAMYNSAFQMFQRIDLSYVPSATRMGDVNVSMFGHQFGKLFQTRNRNGMLASLSLARLLNAAVDNGKDPVLGYLHQTPEMSKLTFFMLAAGLEEEDVHLVINQPVVIEMMRRMKDGRKGDEESSMRQIMEDILSELTANGQGIEEADPKTYWKALKTVADMGKDDYTSALGIGFDRLRTTDDLDLLKNQCAVLSTLRHISGPANDLAQFVRYTRPESAKGAIGTDIASIIAKKANLDDFRERIAKKQLNTISGMGELMKQRDSNIGWSEEYLNGMLGKRLPEVVALNSLMIDNSFDMFSYFFPQARRTWYDFIVKMAREYDYNTIDESLIRKIANDMILWKLLSDKNFVQGDPQEEQKRILVDVPKDLQDLKERIEKAHENSGTDWEAERLYENVFLKKIRVTSPEEQKAPRLMFFMDGAPAEGTRDLISAGWNELMQSKDPKIRKLATDLFKYNMYSNGFSYGMYEFAHFAPYSVLAGTPGYIDALRRMVGRSYVSWRDEREMENFMNQYYMNHWGEGHLVSQMKAENMPWTITAKGLKVDSTDMKFNETVASNRYIIVSSSIPGNRKGARSQTLYRVDRIGDGVYLSPASKLGAFSRRSQVTRQYNPVVDYHDIQPVTPGNDSSWGTLSSGLKDKFIVDSNSNIEAPGMMAADRTAAANARLSSYFGMNVTAKDVRNAEDKQAGITKSDSELDRLAKRSGEVARKADVITGSEAESLAQTMPVEDENVNSAPVEEKVQERQFTDAEMLKAAQDAFKNNMFGSIKVVDKDTATGEYVVNDVPATPDNVRKARQQRTFTELNRKLREILNRHGIGIGVLYNAEARMNLGGVAVFDTANVTAEGLLELIRLAEGYEGEQALPEEFAHVALEMLGHDHVLVKRLLNAIDGSDEALREAYESEEGNLYDEYVKVYGNENRDKLVLEAAGKLVAKALLREQKIRTGGIRGLVTRIVDAIKSMLRKFSRNEVQDAIFEAGGIASKIAREMLGGRLADDMSIQNIASNDSMFSIVKTNLTDKQDILSKLVKTETKRYEILKKRAGYYNVGTAPASVEAAERQLKKLEASIRSHKVEDAVMTYLNDGLAFLAATEKSLDDSVNSGRPMNSVCKKLNTVRDTLYSYAKAVDYIREGISSKEIADSLNLTETLDRLQGVLNKFHDKYMSLARRYFEEMLSNVYGESGVTVEIGRERGRRISIHEMATRADRDISLASRWFDSIADCNDYVLKAIDDITRDAKMRARRHVAEIKPRIEVAVADLVRETGSRDQNFMFEKDADGHRTGKYISEEASKKLPKAQKKFYDTMIAIQKEADNLLPKPLIEKRGPLGIVMVRKYAMERVAAAKGFSGKMLEAWEGIRNEVMETSEDFDPEVQEVAVDFEGNKVDMLPVKFLNKGKKESYDDMTDDVAASMMAYAGMAYEYGEMNNVVNTLENAKYMAGERDVVQRSGNRQRQETISSDDISFTSPFTKKAAQLHAQKALEDFFSMHIYGHLAADEGTFGNTRISKRKVVNMVNSLTSFSQMAFNLTQRISNVTTGAMQVVVESAGKGVYNIADVTWASNVYMTNTADRFVQNGKTESDNKLSLWNEHFDVHQDNGRYNNKYKKDNISRWFNTNMLYAGLTAGEDYLSSVTSLAVARNYKVKDASGKVGNLWDAYEVKYLDAANKTGAYLALKKGYTKTDGSPITVEDEKKFAKQVAALNFEMQGIYNVDDRSAVQQYTFGALIIMYRKWIAPAIKRRYGREQYSALKGTYEMGYYRSLWNLLTESLVDAKDAVTADQSDAALLNIFNDISAFANAWKINYGKMTTYERSCITKACTELGTVAGLWLATTLLLRLPPDDKDGMLGWAESMMLSQMLRLRSELWAQTPIGVIPESLRILKSPFAAADPIKRTLDTFQLILPWNYFTKIKSGRYRGHSKAYQYMMSLPILGMYRQVQKFIDPTPLIQYYSNN